MGGSGSNMSTATADVVVLIKSAFVNHLMVLPVILQKVQFFLITLMWMKTQTIETRTKR
jgi:hypothetical protein